MRQCLPTWMVAAVAVLASWSLAPTDLAAQQDAQYTQFIFNKLAYNAGYAGAVESGEVSVVAREQWYGLEGAPSSQVVTLNTPFSELGPGMGIRLNRVAVGLEEQYTLDGSYAYGFPLGRGTRMGLGLSASLRYFSVNYQDARPVQGGGVDVAIPGASASKIVPNFGAGVYVEGPSFYVGFGVPRLLENDVDLGSDETIISREARHYYFMTGVTFPSKSKVRLQPQALIKYVPNAPFDAEFNLLLYLGGNIFTGGGYRMGGDGRGESASAMFGAILARHLTFSFSYDIGLSDFSTDQGGSLEAMMMYSFGRRGSGTGRLIDPRDL